MTLERPADGKTPAWTEEDELEFQIGDMDGNAFNNETEVKNETKLKEEVKKK